MQGGTAGVRDSDCGDRNDGRGGSDDGAGEFGGVAFVIWKARAEGLAWIRALGFVPRLYFSGLSILLIFTLIYS